MLLSCPLPPHPVTRFAPSPTGLLHLGHLVNAIFVWGLARRFDGSVILRIEDHDGGRYRPTWETGILDDLDWLGLEPDGVGTAAFRGEGHAACGLRQRDRQERYLALARALEAGPGVYACTCTRRDIAARDRSDATELRYPGTCRERRRAPERIVGQGWRVILPDEEVTFTDALQGLQCQRPAQQCGDLLLRDRHGCWTYQFAVTADDLDQGITLVIRGEDLLPSSGRQILLGRLLGRADPPIWLHHPLVLDDHGRKLSKRDGVPGVADLRATGWEPERVLGLAAQAAGLMPDAARVAPQDLGDLFGDWHAPTGPLPSNAS